MMILTRLLGASAEKRLLLSREPKPRTTSDKLQHLSSLRNNTWTRSYVPPGTRCNFLTSRFASIEGLPLSPGILSCRKSTRDDAHECFDGSGSGQEDNEHSNERRLREDAPIPRAASHRRSLIGGCNDAETDGVHRDRDI